MSQISPFQNHLSLPDFREPYLTTFFKTRNIDMQNSVKYLTENLNLTDPAEVLADTTNKWII